MQIVIDIDDEDYKRIQDIPDVFNSLTSRAYSAIRNGTPLPKGHGDLIDKSEAIISLFDYYSGKKTVGQCIYEVKTIVEADKEVKADADSD